MTTLVSSQDLVDKYYPLGILYVKRLVKYLNKKGMVVDVDQLESDMGLFLTKVIKRYEDKNKEENFFNHAFKGWMVDNIRCVGKKSRYVSLDPTFDQEDSSEELWITANLAESPYQDVIQRLMAGDSINSILNELDISRYQWEEKILPELQQYFGDQGFE